MKGKFLIGVMALSLVGGIGSALALTRDSATASGNTPTFDSAIYLYWDSESEESAGMSDIGSIGLNTPVYRYLTVAPKSSKSVTGTVTLTFTLAASTGCTVKGLTVDVYATETLLDDSTVVAGIDGLTASPELDENHLSGTATFTISAGEAVHETVKYYAIKVNYDGTPDGEKELGGRVTIAQSFVA